MCVFIRVCVCVFFSVSSGSKKAKPQPRRQRTMIFFARDRKQIPEMLFGQRGEVRYSPIWLLQISNLAGCFTNLLLASYKGTVSVSRAPHPHPPPQPPPACPPPPPRRSPPPPPAGRPPPAPGPRVPPPRRGVSRQPPRAGCPPPVQAPSFPGRGCAAACGPRGRSGRHEPPPRTANSAAPGVGGP